MAKISEKSATFTFKKGNKTGKTSIIEDFPYKRMEGSFLIDKNDNYQAFLKISTLNLYSLSDDEQAILMDGLTSLLRVYVECVNIISLKFPPALEKNIQFWQRKLIEARNNRSLPQITSCQDNLNKLFWVEKNLPELEFFMMVFGDTKEELETNIKLIRRFGSDIFSTEMKPEQTESIIYKLCNMNTEI